MSSNNEQKNNGPSFQEVFDTMLEAIDNISAKIPEGDYLILVNSLKKIFDMKKDVIRETVVYQFVEVERKRRAKPKPRAVISDEKKIETELYTQCKFCDSLVVHKHFPRHRRTAKCIRITASKLQASREGKVIVQHNSDLLTIYREDRDEVEQKIVDREVPLEEEKDEKKDEKTKKKKTKKKKTKVKKPSIASSMHDPVEPDDDSDDEPLVEPRYRLMINKPIPEPEPEPEPEPDSDDEPIVQPRRSPRRR